MIKIKHCFVYSAIYDRSQSSLGHGYSDHRTPSNLSNQLFGGTCSAGASHLDIDAPDSSDHLTDYGVDVPLDISGTHYKCL